jgi:hypothetical protein
MLLVYKRFHIVSVNARVSWRISLIYQQVFVAMSKKNHETIYGTVNSKKLDELQQYFDTTKILAAVDTIDEICSSICDLDGIRLELLNLHSMAHTIINGDSTINAPTGTCIWEVAQDLELQIDDFATKLNGISTMLGRLGELAPDEEDEENFDFDE